MKLEVKTSSKSYPIHIQRGILSHIHEYVENQHVFIITDEGVPLEHQEKLHQQFPDAKLYVAPEGESAKSFAVMEDIQKEMLKDDMSRKDLVIALGGGVVSDLAGFVAASYMRGISYINIPTTTLSQIDSSIGGKTAINLAGRKNSIGAFWQPDAVFIDMDVLKTLPSRHFYNGLAEAIKTGLILDKELFELFEKEEIEDCLDEVIIRSLECKKKIVEEDEREENVRKLLNFGHSIGHAYESYYDMESYYHGECVAMGMMTILENEEIKNRLQKVLEKMQLPVSCDVDPEKIYEIMKNDKKANHDGITIVQVDEIGKGHLEEWSWEDVRRKLG